MNVLFISSVSPYQSVGGIERYLINLIDYASNSKDQRVIIMLASQKSRKPKAVGNVTIVFCPALGYRNYASDHQAAAAFRSQLAEVIKKYKINIICAENFHLGSSAAFSLQLNIEANLQNVPVVLRLHSFAQTDLQAQLISQLDWRHVSCVSKSVAGDCFSKGTDVELLSSDYLGVNTNVFKPNPQARQKLLSELKLPSDSKLVFTATRILFGNRSILKQKGLINLIRAFSKLSPYHPKLRLIIGVGSAPDNLRREFEKTYNQLLGYLMLHDIKDKTVVKKFSLDQIPLAYQASDVFVLASENETFGQVFLEAMASGSAVIGTKVGGIPEIIRDNYSGFLVAPNDATVLSQKIEALISDDQLSQRLGAHGLETVASKFTASAQFDKFFRLLRSFAA